MKHHRVILAVATAAGLFTISASAQVADPMYNQPMYQGSSGAQYRYDLSNPGDQLMYSVDPGAQLNDSINPNVQLDRSLGEYGGGAIP
jgi:hypothetical protein